MGARIDVVGQPGVVEDLIEVVAGVEEPAVVDRQEHAIDPRDDVAGVDGEDLVDLDGRDRRLA